MNNVVMKAIAGVGILRWVLATLLLALGSSHLFAQQRNFSVGIAGVPTSERRVALIIGNAAYKAGKLTNPVNDARAMASRLRTLGFDVVLRENLKMREIGGVYREFRSKITPGGVALVFYAGHGLQIKGQNYFPVVDSEIDSEEDVPLQSLNLGTLLDTMEEAKAGVSLVLLDACRDNPYARRFRSASRGLAKVEAASGTLIHYATKPGSVASDGSGKNGTYTEALLTQIGEPNVPVEQMLKRVTNRVVAETKGKQEPWVEGSLRGEFYFIFQGPTTVQVQSSATAPDPTAVELSFWESIKDSKSPDEFNAYLGQYPGGVYVALAKARLKVLESPKVVKPEPAKSLETIVSFSGDASGEAIAKVPEVNGSRKAASVQFNLRSKIENDSIALLQSRFPNVRIDVPSASETALAVNIGVTEINYPRDKIDMVIFGQSYMGGQCELLISVSALNGKTFSRRYQLSWRVPVMGDTWANIGEQHEDIAAGSQEMIKQELLKKLRGLLDEDEIRSIARL